jgi:hypothetical protein
MPVAKLWADSLKLARVCDTADEAKAAISRISQVGSIALREAMVLFAIAKSGRNRPDFRRLEKMTRANATSIFFTAGSLAVKDLVRTDHEGIVELTDSGQSLLARCLP